MNVLLIGASGYIGKKIIKKLYEDGHAISVVIRKSSNIDDIREYIDNVVYNTDYDEMYFELNRIKPDCFINVSGKYYGSHNMNTIQEMIESNILFVTLVLDAAVKAGCKNVIHTSSFQQCYQGKIYNPVNLYAATKQSFEDILKFYTESKSLKSIVLQLFDTYGADDSRNKIFNRIRNLKEDESFDLSPGMQKMYLCYIDDVVEAYMVAIRQLLCENDGFMGKYAIRGDKPIELRKFVDMYCTSMDREYLLNWGKRDYMKREIMDPTDYGKVLPNWCMNVSYEEGIKLCAEYDRRAL